MDPKNGILHLAPIWDSCLLLCGDPFGTRLGGAVGHICRILVRRCGYDFCGFYDLQAQLLSSWIGKQPAPAWAQSPVEHKLPDVRTYTYLLLQLQMCHI